MALVVTGALPFMLAGSILHYQRVAGQEGSNDELFGPATQVRVKTMS